MGSIHIHIKFVKTVNQTPLDWLKTHLLLAMQQTFPKALWRLK